MFDFAGKTRQIQRLLTNFILLFRLSWVTALTDANRCTLGDQNNSNSAAAQFYSTHVTLWYTSKM